MNPTISIIIPSYNQAEYLEDCIESAYNQTRAPLEILVVDDGSTDNSLEIAQRYEFKNLPMIESPVRVISQTNRGLSSARNTGIMNAKGDYCFFLDADDMLKEDALEKITAEIVRSNADIVAPSFKEFGKSDREVIIGSFTMEELKVANRLGYFCAIRRQALCDVGGYSSRMTWGWEDWHIWFNLFSRGKTVSVLKDILVMYRIKEKSMIHTANEHGIELYNQIRKDFPHIFK